MTSNTHLRRSGNAGASKKPNAAQRRFRALVQKIEHTRARLNAWQAALPAFRTAYEEKVRPLLTRARVQDRAWLLALDRAAGRIEWSRADRRTLAAMLVQQSRALLAGDANDAEVAAVFRRHSGEDYETALRQEADMMRDALEDIIGADIDDEHHANARDAYARVDPQARKAADTQGEPDWEDMRAAGASAAAAKQARREAERARVTQSVRTIYRKLVSELHPDREPDEARRRTKTGMMQKVNEAYEKNDLLTLLEAQLQLEQLDAAALDALDAATLRRYNTVLAEQVEELEHALDSAEGTFAMEYRIDAGRRLDPARVGALIERACKDIRASLKERAGQIEGMQHAPTMRAWLKAIRARQAGRTHTAWDGDEDDDLPF